MVCRRWTVMVLILLSSQMRRKERTRLRGAHQPTATTASRTVRYRCPAPDTSTVRVRRITLSARAIPGVVTPHLVWWCSHRKSGGKGRNPRPAWGSGRHEHLPLTSQLTNPQGRTP